MTRLLSEDFEKRLAFLLEQQMQTCWTHEMAAAIRELHRLLATAKVEGAAEVSRLQGTLQEITKCPNGKSKNWPEIDELARAALAAPTTAAVEAMEAMRKALEHQKNALHILLDRGCRTGESDVRLGIKQIDAALAAYEEATRG